MKKTGLVLVVLSLMLVLFACSGRTRLKVYMPTEYIDEALVEAFEDAFEVRVDIIPFDSNESAIPQIEANVYDVIVPSDYAIEELVSKGLLEEIDWTQITEMDKDTDLDDGLIGILDTLKSGTDGFNLLKYGVPYFWGNVGILYNTETVDLAFLQTENWNALRSFSHKVMFYDSSRDSFMIALKQIGVATSVNSATEQQILDAENWLKATGPNTQFLTDEVLDDMLHPAKHDMAVTYSGDAVYLMSENEKLDYYVPTTGTNVWLDAFVVPKNAKEKELAYAFINFMVSYESMLANTIEIGYTSPRADVIAEIIETETYDAESYVIVVREIDEVFRFNSVLKSLIEQAWARVRSS
ncbi:MAG: ABC transporter substrate-binding protein [Acholeplasmataceae bacterium]|nr:ABC transporter substrate-binding protein [Acholeplasmataceae bacterium]